MRRRHWPGCPAGETPDQLHGLALRAAVGARPCSLWLSSAPGRTYAHAARAPRLTPPPHPPPHPELPAAALAAVVEACKAGAKVVDLCEKGDSLLNE